MARDWLGKPQIIEKLGLGLASGITGTIVLLSWLGVSPLVRLEGGSLDVRFKLRGERPAGQEIGRAASGRPISVAVHRVCSPHYRLVRHG